MRSWQRRALSRYLLARQDDFLVVATPGAGKTSYALRVAQELMAAGMIQQVVVVTPTEHLKTQWAVAAAAHGIALDPRFSTSLGRLSADYQGLAVTYAGVAAAAPVFRLRTMARPTLVVLDEIHHAGDARSWGEAVRQAFAPAVRRLALTGTPFRSDDNPIPFARYEPAGDGTQRSVADFSYGYADALRDGVVRPVLFMAYSGQTTWRTRAGDEVAVRLGEATSAEHAQRAWRTALDPEGDWVPSVLRAAHRRLSQLREQVPDTAGLVIASDQADARAYAALLHELTGTAPVLVLSDDPGSSARIAAFRAASSPWIVAVRMVSEGVDLPRLGVLVYASNVSTPMFFAQAVGRVLRARGRSASAQSATVFLPSIARLLALAGAMEVERDHVLGAPRHSDEWDELVEASADSDGEEDAPAFERLGASAELDHVLFDGAAWGTAAHAGTEEEQEFLGIPGLLAPDQVTQLLRQRQDEQVQARIDYLRTHRG